MTKDIFQLIKKSKADFIQVNFTEGNSNRVLFEKKNLKDFSKVSFSRVSASAWIGKKYGTATSNTFSEKLLNNAIKIAKASEDLNFFYGLPPLKKIHLLKGLYFGKKTEEEILSSAESLMTDLNKNEIMPDAALEYSTFSNRVVNSLGVDLEEKGSIFSGSVVYVLKNKEDILYADAELSRKIPSKDKINNFSKNALEELRSLKNPVKISKFPEVIIFEQKALAQLLDSAFLNNFNGLNILKKRSIFAEKENQKLFSENLNIINSGVLEGGIGSQSFDGEGSHSQETILVKEGVLKNFIYDYNTANHLNKKSTGNSTGGGIGFNNVIIKKGKGINENNALIIILIKID